MHRDSLNGFLVLTLFAIVSMVGCSDDDGPTSPTNTHPIVGSWEQVFDDPDHYYKITFHADGTGSEMAEFQGNLDYESDFTYKIVQGKTNGTVEIYFGEGEVFSSPFSIDGDSMTVDFDGETAEFNRVGTGPDPVPDISGDWTLTSTVVESTCGGFPGEAQTYCVTITRDGDIVTLQVGNETIVGTMITNSTAHFDRSGNGCTVDLILTLSPDWTRLTGSNPMDCPATEMSEGCTENSTIEATRKAGGC